MNSSGVCGVVLCGGKSSRMGTDKGLLVYQGKTLVEHALDPIRSWCHPLYISTNALHYQHLGLPLISDIHQGIGPLAAWHAGLTQHRSGPVLFVACDMPDVNVSLLQEMVRMATSFDVVYCQLSIEPILPLPVVLGPKILPVIEALIGEKDYKLQRVVEQAGADASLKIRAIALDKEPKNINSSTDLTN